MGTAEGDAEQEAIDFVAVAALQQLSLDIAPGTVKSRLSRARTN